MDETLCLWKRHQYLAIIANGAVSNVLVSVIKTSVNICDTDIVSRGILYTFKMF